MNKNIVILALVVAVLTSCSARKDYPGVEYAPQMYHTVPYEPLTQITEEGYPSGLFEDFYYQVQFKGATNSLDYNDYDGKVAINEKLPVAGTVKRQYLTSMNDAVTADQKLLNYQYHKDSLAFAALEANPLRMGDYDSTALITQGKELYLGVCTPCHGKDGDGQGKVADVYPGVANLKGGAYLNITEGHIFHVITHGKGKMWSHKSQVSPEDRWKIAMYVKELQKGK